MQRTKIEWADYVWNPIKGICPAGCWYCYAKKFYKRFHRAPELSLVSYNELQEPRIKKKPQKIFLCSTMEIFHPKIHPSWRELIFNIIKRCPQHIFYILTKFPENIDREMPNNVWLGITLEKTNWERFKFFQNYYYNNYVKIKFISFETLLEEIEQDFLNDIVYPYSFINWIIIGKLTGYGRKYNPKPEWIYQIIYQANKHGIPVFLKDNLIQILEREIVMKYREFPERKK